MTARWEKLNTKQKLFCKKTDAVRINLMAPAEFFLNQCSLNWFKMDLSTLILSEDQNTLCHAMAKLEQFI